MIEKEKEKETAGTKTGEGFSIMGLFGRKDEKLSNPKESNTDNKEIATESFSLIQNHRECHRDREGFNNSNSIIEGFNVEEETQRNAGNIAAVKDSIQTINDRINKIETENAKTAADIKTHDKRITKNENDINEFRQEMKKSKENAQNVANAASANYNL